MTWDKEKWDAYNKKYYVKRKEELKARRRKYYRENVEKCLECSKKANLSEEAKKRKADRQRDSRKRFPEKHRARKVLQRAVKAGKISKTACER